MFLPILSIDDGYGLTYGLRTSFVGGTAIHDAPVGAGIVGWHSPAGARSREDVRARARRFVATARCGPVPAAPSCDGGPRADAPAGEHRPLAPGAPLLRARAVPAVRRRRDQPSAAPRIRLGATASFATVAFGDVDDRMTTAGVFAEVDTRRDPLFPRNAVFARTAWTRLSFADPEPPAYPTAAARGGSTTARLSRRHRSGGHYRPAAGGPRSMVRCRRMPSQSSAAPTPCAASGPDTPWATTSGPARSKHVRLSRP